MNPLEKVAKPLSVIIQMCIWIDNTKEWRRNTCIYLCVTSVTIAIKETNITVDSTDLVIHALQRRLNILFLSRLYRHHQRTKTLFCSMLSGTICLLAKKSTKKTPKILPKSDIPLLRDYKLWIARRKICESW